MDDKINDEEQQPLIYIPFSLSYYITLLDTKNLTNNKKEV